MTVMDVIRARHSVREYTGRPIGDEVLEKLAALVEEVRRESGLGIQLVQGNPEVYNVVARFGLIHGCADSIAFTAAGTEDDERIGYWGQKIVLAVQELGLNTCWVAMCSRKKTKASLPAGHKLRLVISVGYGVDNGRERKSKTLDELCTVECEPVPQWFGLAMEAAQLAPTAMNAQKFHIALLADGKTVRIEAPAGGYRVLDMGIVRRNFELAANEAGGDWRWERPL